LFIESASKDPPNKIVFSFDDWTSYAVVALVVVVVVVVPLITVPLVIVVRRWRRLVTIHVFGVMHLYERSNLEVEELR